MRSVDALVRIVHDVAGGSVSGPPEACADCTDQAERLAARGVRVIPAGAVLVTEEHLAATLCPEGGCDMHREQACIILNALRWRS